MRQKTRVKRPPKPQDRRSTKGQQALDEAIQGTRLVIANRLAVFRERDTLIFGISVYAIYINYFFFLLNRIPQSAAPGLFFAFVFVCISPVIFLRKFIQHVDQSAFREWIRRFQIAVPFLLCPLAALYFWLGSNFWEYALLAIGLALSGWVAFRRLKQ